MEELTIKQFEEKLKVSADVFTKKWIKFMHNAVKEDKFLSEHNAFVVSNMFFTALYKESLCYLDVYPTLGDSTLEIDKNFLTWMINSLNTAHKSFVEKHGIDVFNSLFNSDSSAGGYIG